MFQSDAATGRRTVEQLARAVVAAIKDPELDQQEAEDLMKILLACEPYRQSGRGAPVVYFEKAWASDYTNTYSYSAIAVLDEDCIHQAWYTTAARGRSGPLNWRELVEFMGPVGLESLRVLQGG